MKDSIAIIWIVAISVVALIAFMILRKDRPMAGTASPRSASQVTTQSASLPPTATRIIKNDQNKLSLISYNTATNEIVNSREFSFSEASRLAGSIAKVCLGSSNGGFGAFGYSECATVRN